MEFNLPEPWVDFDFRPGMEMALAEARKSEAKGDVPVGAVILGPGGEVLATGRNQSIELNDPTAHAEIQAIRKAGEKIGNYRLMDCVLVATLEPCLMCAGAIIHSRLKGVVYGATDLKAGAIATCLRAGELECSNHSFFFISGVMEKECSSMLSEFFQKRRAEKKEQKSCA